MLGDARTGRSFPAGERNSLELEKVQVMMMGILALNHSQLPKKQGVGFGGMKEA